MSNHIKIIEFKTTYERLPVLGDVLSDKVDDQGYKLDANGRRIMVDQEVDWVVYCPAHSPMSTKNAERIKHIMVSGELADISDNHHQKHNKMLERWKAIEPFYEAWKKGEEAVQSGTPLGRWPGISAEKAKILRHYGIGTVEDIAALTDNQLGKIRLPNVRALREEAKLFLSNLGSYDSAKREAEISEELEAMKQELLMQSEQLKAALEQLHQKEETDNELLEIKENLDKLKVKYNKNDGIEKLRAILQKAMYVPVPE